jgi:hypothetical protein
MQFISIRNQQRTLGRPAAGYQSARLGARRSISSLLQFCKLQLRVLTNLLQPAPALRAMALDRSSPFRTRHGYTLDVAWKYLETLEQLTAVYTSDLARQNHICPSYQIVSRPGADTHCNSDTQHLWPDCCAREPRK